MVNERFLCVWDSFEVKTNLYTVHRIKCEYFAFISRYKKMHTII